MKQAPYSSFSITFDFWGNQSGGRPRQSINGATRSPRTQTSARWGIITEEKRWRARALKMQSADRQKCTELREDGGRERLRKLSLPPRRLPHPTTDLRYPQGTDLYRTDDLPLCWKTRPSLGSPARRKREGRTDLRERPLRGSIRTGLQMVGGGLRRAGHRLKARSCGLAGTSYPELPS